MAPVAYREAVRSALADEMEADEQVVLMGEDVSQGGFFNVTPGDHTLNGSAVENDESLGDIVYLTRGGWLTFVRFAPATAFR